jgi:hypothetical protein
MPYFTKKPVQIEARQYDGTQESAIELADWVNTNGHEAYCGNILVIVTLEGEHRANPGDWIIKGVAGEFYPCKPDIFAATYEPVSPSESDFDA